MNQNSSDNSKEECRSRECRWGRGGGKEHRNTYSAVWDGLERETARQTRSSEFCTSLGLDSAQ